MNRRQDIIERKDEIKNWISLNQSKAYLCRRLKCKPTTLNRYLTLLEIKYLGNQGGKGIKTDKKYKTALEYIESGSVIKSHLLKIKLLRDGLKKHKCEKCGKTIWLGQPIPLELHHIDGDRFNNELENLKLLCPNCHALEDNNSGAANKK
jgi:Zn finger protein HypA/HybF involved in hydrogenase expression